MISSLSENNPSWKNEAKKKKDGRTMETFPGMSKLQR
jgi:hypothetical protein